MERLIKSEPLGLYSLVARYDRNEINNPISHVCSNCDGWGKIFYSNYWDKCEKCNGNGEVEI